MNLSQSFFRGIVRGCGLALLGVALTGVLIPLRGQEQPPQQEKNVKPGPKRDNFGRQLARESREAAGEEEKDETAQFKQSAAVQWIAQKTGLSLQNAYLLCVLLNFAVNVPRVYICHSEGDAGSTKSQRGSAA
jgi:hypothetical protein